VACSNHKTLDNFYWNSSALVTILPLLDKIVACYD
jgi:hypothetical protein